MSEPTKDIPKSRQAEKEFFDKVRDAYLSFYLPGDFEAEVTAAALAMRAMEFDSIGLAAWWPDISKRMDMLAERSKAEGK